MCSIATAHCLCSCMQATQNFRHELAQMRRTFRFSPYLEQVLEKSPPKTVLAKVDGHTVDAFACTCFGICLFMFVFVFVCEALLVCLYMHVRVWVWMGGSACACFCACTEKVHLSARIHVCSATLLHPRCSLIPMPLLTHPLLHHHYCTSVARSPPAAPPLLAHPHAAAHSSPAAPPLLHLHCSLIPKPLLAHPLLHRRCSLIPCGTTTAAPPLLTDHAAPPLLCHHCRTTTAH